MKTSLARYLEAIKLLEKIKEVKRMTSSTVSGDRESSAEHSWSVAVLAWLFAPKLAEEFNQSLDTCRMVKMALMHDLVEIIAGDVPVFNRAARLAIKDEEEAAADEIFKKIPQPLGDELREIWQEYESKKTLEARIVKGLDRLSGAISRLTTGQGWPSEITPEDVDEIQSPQIGFSQTLKELYHLIKKEGQASGLMNE